MYIYLIKFLKTINNIIAVKTNSKGRQINFFLLCRVRISVSSASFCDFAVLSFTVSTLFSIALKVSPDWKVSILISFDNEATFWEISFNHFLKLLHYTPHIYH